MEHGDCQTILGMDNDMMKLLSEVKSRPRAN